MRLPISVDALSDWARRDIISGLSKDCDKAEREPDSDISAAWGGDLPELFWLFLFECLLDVGLVSSSKKNQLLNMRNLQITLEYIGTLATE